MFLVNKKYYHPSKHARVLAILDSLAQDSQVSQNELGRRANLSGAMVNQYLKELVDNEYIQYERINGKSFRYLLTDQGENIRRTMFSSFSSETVQIYTALKNSIMSRLSALKSQGIKKLALFGASETCEVVLQALRAKGDFEVTALVDNDPAKHGSSLCGYIISPPQILEAAKPQAVVITSYGRQEEILRQLLPYRDKQHVEIVRL